VAGTRPELTAAMCDGNRDALADALDGVLDRLAEARDALRGGGSLLPLFAEGHAARQRWVGFEMGGAEIVLDPAAPSLRAELTELGRSGGHLDEIGEHALHGWRPAP
jgi:prephenate dehydrogenase